MTNKPKYTFLLPAYKAKYFEEALRSIKAQTYRYFRVLVSDDCSPEPLKPIFDRVCGDDPRFTFRRNAENMGGKSLVAHWNLLVGMCDTEWLVMASDDDVYKPEFLEKMDGLQRKYSKADLLRARTQNIDSKGLMRGGDDQSKDFMDVLHYMQRFYEPNFIWCIANYCFRTRPLQENGGFVDFPLAWFSDDATVFLMANKGCAVTEDVSFFFRESGDNISGQWGVPKDSSAKCCATLKYNKWIRNYMKRYESWTEKELYSSIMSAHKRKIRSNLLNFIFHTPFPFFVHCLLVCPNDIGLNKWRMLGHYIRGNFF